MAKQYWRKAKYLCQKDKVLFWGTFEESLKYPVKAKSIHVLKNELQVELA